MTTPAELRAKVDLDLIEEANTKTDAYIRSLEELRNAMMPLLVCLIVLAILLALHAAQLFGVLQFRVWSLLPTIAVMLASMPLSRRVNRLTEERAERRAEIGMYFEEMDNRSAPQDRGLKAAWEAET